MEAERFHASGVFRINGLLNAGEITLSRGGLYQAGDIGCTTLRVVQDAHVISLGRRKRALEAQSIEGDTLELLDTQAAVVRGRFVRVLLLHALQRFHHIDLLQLVEHYPVYK